MSDAIREQIYSTLDQKETDELLAIWQANNRAEWSETAFDVIREILEARQGELPVQHAPVMESESAQKSSEQDQDAVFYQPKDVLWLEKWLHRAAIAAIVAAAVVNLLQLLSTQGIGQSFFPRNTMEGTGWLIAILLSVFEIILEGILFYFPLKALASILKILMAMEFNSRNPQR